jgi:hypothetical protein
MKKSVKAPASMVSSSEVKQVAENAAAVENAKKVTVVSDKLSRAQIIEKMTVDLAKASEKNPKDGARALEAYTQFFQLGEKEELLKMVQKIDTERGLIVLKQGFNLPILLSEKSDLYEFLDIMDKILDPNASPFLNVVKWGQNGDYEVALETWAGVYALITLLSYGRQTPNFDWLATEASEFVPNDDYFFNSVFKVIDAFVADPENNGGLMKGMLEFLIPDTFKAMDELFQRDSLKKLGITITSPSEGEGVLFTSTLANVMTYVMYDIFSPVVPEEVEEEAEAEGEPQPTTVKAGKEPTQSQKEEIPEEFAAGGAGGDEGVIVEDDEIVGDDDGLEPEYNDDDGIVEDEEI